MTQDGKHCPGICLFRFVLMKNLKGNLEKQGHTHVILYVFFTEC